MSYVCYAGIALVVSLAGAQNDALQLEEAVSTLEHWQNDYGPRDLDQSIRAIQSRASAGDVALADRLLGIVRNERLPAIVRSRTFAVAWEKADGPAARKVIGMATGWATELSGPRTGGESSLTSQGVLLSNFIASGVSHIQTVLPDASDQQEILSLLRIYSTRIHLSGSAQARALKLIAASPAPLRMRQACAFEVIASGKAYSPAIRDLLDESWFPKLRSLAKESPDADRFHWIATDVLAHFGDQEILPILKAWRPRFEGRKRHGPDFYIWRIEVQHPPSKLLEYIGSSEEPLGQKERVWAVERAVALGVPKAEIRDAILKYAERVTDVGKHGYRLGLDRLKNSGQELGVLREDDLGDVLILEIPH